MIFLAAGWISIWILDMKYYNRLLEGSVHALLELEKVEFKVFTENVNKINLSTSIEKSFGCKLNHERTKWFLDARNWFYLVFLLAILFMACILGFKAFLNY